jgi:hypothetical protein
MPIQSSFPTVADQVISSNKNIIEILGQINSLTTTTEQSINIQVYDENGVLRSFAVPSFSSLKGEIDRLNNNINSLYSIDAGGAMIATSNQNKYKKIITVDLNREVVSLRVIRPGRYVVNLQYYRGHRPIEAKFEAIRVDPYKVLFRRENIKIETTGKEMTVMTLDFDENGNLTSFDTETFHPFVYKKMYGGPN